MKREFVPLIAVTLLAALAIWYFGLRSPAEDSRRADRALFLVPMSPIGSVSEPPEEFRWRSLRDAKKYEVQLFDPTMKQIWKGSAAENYLACPSEVSEYLATGQPLYYRVIAKGSFGKEIVASEHVYFQLSPSTGG